MLISHAYKFIFFSQGKAASSTVEDLLWRYNDDPRILLTNYKQKLFRKKAGYSGYGTKGRYRSPLPGLTYSKRPNASEHAVPSVVRPELDWIFDAYFKIGFVRNPWDWVVSCFDFNNAHNFVGSEEPTLGVNEVKWVHGKMHAFRKGLKTRTCYQYAFLSDSLDGKGDIVMDYVGRVETLADDVVKICGILQLDPIDPKTIGNLNSREPKRRSYQERYTVDAADLVYDLYQKDVEYFKYTFD